VLADDLRRFVALGGPCPGVPAHDVAAGIEHEDRVVLDAIHYQPEALFAGAKQVLLLLAFRQIPRDLRKAA
jgi:hypothetical protein